MDLHISINYPVHPKLLKPAIFQATCQGEAAWFDPESGGECDLPAFLALPKSHKVIRHRGVSFQQPEGAELGAAGASASAYRSWIYPTVRNRRPQPFQGGRRAPEPFGRGLFPSATSARSGQYDSGPCNAFCAYPYTAERAFLPPKIASHS